MIQKYLESICNDLRCNRAVIAKIHGTKQEDGSLSLDSAFSIMFEHCNDIHSAKPLVQNVPISVIKTEFGEDLHSIVVADIDHAENPKCVSHLKRLGTKVIINQLLFYGNYVWGVFSLQFKYSPIFVNEGKLDPNFISLLKNYKQSILTSSNYENK